MQESKEFVVEGKLAVTGNMPFIRLIVRAAAGAYEVAGPLKKELNRLQGRRVRVRGELKPARGIGIRGIIVVREYQLVKL